MDTNKILLIFGLILLLFFIMHNVRVQSSTPTTTATKTTTVVYKKPVTVATPTLNPNYNAYKAQYYN
jgi:hypothetical protein